MSHKLLLSGMVVSIGMLLGRLMGFVRESSIASIYGVTSQADIAVLLLTIPDILISILVASGLSAALIPEFKHLSHKNKMALFAQVSVVMGLVFTLASFILSLMPSVLVYIFSPGLSDQASLSAQALISNVLWLVPLTVLSGVTTAYLQSREHFAMPAMGTLIFNSCVVIGLIFFISDSKNLHSLLFFILIGGLLRWLSQLWMMRHDIQWAGNFKNSLLNKALVNRYWQTIVALGLLTIYPTIARSFASYSGDGALAMMNYAMRLIALPSSLVITILAVVLFPKLSEMHAKNNEPGFANTLSDGMTWSLLLAVIVMGPILASPETFVLMAFSWGNNIPPDKISIISQLLQVGIMILPLQAVIDMSVAAFNARKKTHIPLRISLLGFILLVPFCWLVSDKFGLPGVIYSVLAGYAFVTILLILNLNKMHNNIFRLRAIMAVMVTGTISYLLSLTPSLFDFSFIVDFVMLAVITSILLVLCLYAYLKKIEF